MDLNSYPILTVLIIAAVSSLLAEIPWRFRVPIVVWEMIFGMMIGPQGLEWARPIGHFTMAGERVDTYTLMAERGLAALFFMAGLELDLKQVNGRPLKLAVQGWGISIVLALAAAVALRSLPVVQAPLMIALALTTTAIGTFMPSLRDAKMLKTKFGSHVLAAGAVGEFLPIITASLVLTRDLPAWQQATFMLGFALLAGLAAAIALGFRCPGIVNLFTRTMHSSSQLPVLLTLVVLFSLAVLSKQIG